MKTFRITTSETAIQEREYFVDATSQEEAMSIFTNSLKDFTQNDYLNDDGYPSSDGEKIESITETDSDGNELIAP